MLMKVARTVAVVNISAATITAVARAVGLFGRMRDDVVAVSGVGEVFMLGLLNLLFVMPPLLGAAAVAGAARRRGRAPDLLLTMMLLGSVPFIVWIPLLSAAAPDVMTYLLLLLAGAYVGLRRAVSGGETVTAP